MKKLLAASKSFTYMAKWSIFIILFCRAKIGKIGERGKSKLQENALAKPRRAFIQAGSSAGYKPIERNSYSFAVSILEAKRAPMSIKARAMKKIQSGRSRKTNIDNTAPINGAMA